MKNVFLALVILIVGIVFCLEMRYAIIVHSPIVAKFDRITGELWIVNSGVWRKVLLENSAPVAGVTITAVENQVKTEGK